MTRREIAARLYAAGVEEATGEALLLFCRFSGIGEAEALAFPDADCAAPALAEALARREGREPLAYILGEACFFHEAYRITPDCLIPRPETELLVERAAALLPAGGRFADFCTGSGCIAVSLCRARPDCTGDGFDISAGAVAVARENAARYEIGARLSLFVRDLRDLATHGPLETAFPRAPYDLILSNPPYVREQEMAALAPELFFEPREALVAEEEGLFFYRLFLTHAAHLLAPRGAFLFEIGAEQAAPLAALAREAGFACRIEKDLCGRDRIAHLTRA